MLTFVNKKRSPIAATQDPAAIRRTNSAITTLFAPDLSNVWMAVNKPLSSENNFIDHHKILLHVVSLKNISFTNENTYQKPEPPRAWKIEMTNCTAKMKKHIMKLNELSSLFNKRI